MRGRDFDLTDRCALVKLSPEVNTCDFICEITRLMHFSDIRIICTSRSFLLKRMLL